MPSPKSNRKGSHEKIRKGRSSLDLRGGCFAADMRRSAPELFAGGSSAEVAAAPKLTKLLLNVTIQRSLGAVRVMMAPEATVEELIAAALRQYEKEVRQPLLRAGDASGFNLHYSQFSLESLDKGEKLASLGSRNFFLFQNKAAGEEANTAVNCGGAVAASTARCSIDAEVKQGLPWLRFMEFLL